MSTSVPSHLKGLPHGIDIAAPGGIDALLGFHRRSFGSAQMNANTGSGDAGSRDGEQGKQKSEPRTFTQDELNAILAEDRRKTEQKFAGFDELKAKAEKFDQAEQESQTELQKAIARAEKAEKEVAAEREAREAAERKSLAATVAAEKGVPAANITGTTREELEASADALVAWRTGQKAEEKQQEEPPRYGGVVPHSGTGQSGPAPQTMDQGRERAKARRSTNTH